MEYVSSLWRVSYANETNNQYSLNLSDMRNKLGDDVEASESNVLVLG